MCAESRADEPWEYLSERPASPFGRVTVEPNGEECSTTVVFEHLPISNRFWPRRMFTVRVRNQRLTTRCVHRFCYTGRRQAQRPSAQDSAWILMGLLESVACDGGAEPADRRAPTDPGPLLGSPRDETKTDDHIRW
jgi:hypothetical protein